jgi:hypothetical protein
VDIDRRHQIVIIFIQMEVAGGPAVTVMEMMPEAGLVVGVNTYFVGLVFHMVDMETLIKFAEPANVLLQICQS